MEIVVHSKKSMFQQKFQNNLYCCNLSVGVALNVRFITNGMSAKTNTQMYVGRTSNNRVIMACDL